MKPQTQSAPQAIMITATRIAALVILIAGFIDITSAFWPKECTIHDLVSDVRQGQVDAVHFYYAGPYTAEAKWSTGLGQQNVATHQFPADAHISDGRHLRDIVRRRLGDKASSVQLTIGRPIKNFGGITSFLPLLYWRFIPHTFLKWAVAIVCGCLAASMLLREDNLRAPHAGYWLFSSVFGIGFSAYIWSEPTPLLKVRGRSQMHTSMSGIRTLGAMSVWTILAVTVAVAWHWAAQNA